jgi:5-methylcytosine-specific restriction endonuclease McrA
MPYKPLSPEARAIKNAKQRARMADPALRAIKNAKENARASDPAQRAIKNAKTRARMADPVIREAKKAKERARKAANREREHAQWADYVSRNGDAVRARSRAYQARKWEEDPEHMRQISRNHYARHAAQKRAESSAYKKANPEKVQAWNNAHRARKLAAPVSDLTPAQWLQILAAYDHRCVYCGRKMRRLTQDHITPLSKGGSHTFSNVVPACRSCNSRKNYGEVLCPIQPLLLL